MFGFWKNMDEDDKSRLVKGTGLVIALFTLYNNWGDYCGDATFKPVYKERAKKYGSSPNCVGFVM